MDYKYIAKSYDELYKEEQLEKLRIIKYNININKKDNLLDIGCGTGISTEFFDCKSIGIDSCFEMLKPGLICGKAENLPFRDKTFDIILVVTSIHHFDAEKAIKEIKRVSKKKVIITLLKKAKRFKHVKDLLNKSFKFEEVDGKKDLIFIQNGN